MTTTPISSSPDKNSTARELAEAHRDFDSSIEKIIRIVSEAESDAAEPVKLLEVNPSTSPSGILPIAFGADPPTIPFPSIIVEVTADEFDRIQAGHLSLPEGWRLGETLYPPA